MGVFRSYTFSDGTSVCVGNLPGRKLPCIYSIDGSVYDVIGHCKSDEKAAALIDALDRLAYGWVKEEI